MVGNEGVVEGGGDGLEALEFLELQFFFRVLPDRRVVRGAVFDPGPQAERVWRWTVWGERSR